MTVIEEKKQISLFFSSESVSIFISSHPALKVCSFGLHLIEMFTVSFLLD
jgi:hypothetical protein